ncbi:TonB family protein [Stutzerimonas xanthomarina]|uniref:TonB family protein n=1 Tax=Stutzerimonas xanthomarina TaxID=271420 RepID=A0A3R9AJA4_9GAMM|nr:TonB family protein [Stutzerimonas xanthomarina]
MAAAQESLGYTHQLEECLAVSEKQVALLVSTVALVLAALSGSAVVIASAAHEKANASDKEIRELQATVIQQETRIQQLTAGMLAMAPILEAASGDAAPVEQVAQGDEPNTGSTDVLAVAAPSTSEDSERPQDAMAKAAESGAVDAAPPAEPAPDAPQRAVDEVLVQRIIANWVRPASAKNGMSVDIVIKMSRAGVINEARVVESSGDEAFDKSATAAILSVNAVTEVQEVSDKIYEELYKERRVRFRPEDLSS